jgi:hypothetical protein
LKERHSNLSCQKADLVKNGKFCKFHVCGGGFNSFQNGSQFYMQLFFMYIKRYRCAPEFFEIIFLKWGPLAYSHPWLMPERSTNCFLFLHKCKSAGVYKGTRGKGKKEGHLKDGKVYMVLKKKKLKN